MVHRPFTTRRGLLVAAALESSWRPNTAPCELSKEALDEIAPILLRSGAAGLVWRRLGPNAQSQTQEEFFQAYKRQTLQSAVHEDDVAQVFRLLQAAHLDAMVVKGWAIARSYPDCGLRHYSDLDLCVRAKDYQRASEVLNEVAEDVWIDLHKGTATLDSAAEDELFERSVIAPLDGVPVRVPCLEDHLRILCLHLLRHGASRPLWLCDVALALESRAANFNWDIFFGNDKRQSDWLECVLGLAHHLLGARLDGTPVVKRANTLPGWLPRSVLRRWGSWYNADYRDRAMHSLWSNRRKPLRLVEDLYFRCDPLRATVEMSGPFNNRPRLPYQIAALMRRTPELAMRMLSSLK